MKFKDFVAPNSIKVELVSTEKDGVIRELVEALVAGGKLEKDQSEGVIAAILRREELGSTGIGRGTAVPHAKFSTMTAPLGAVGVSSKGVEFDSLDGDKVFLFFMLISPAQAPTDHLRALEYISKQLQDDTFCRFLKQSRTPEDVQQILNEADNNQY